MGGFRLLHGDEHVGLCKILLLELPGKRMALPTSIPRTCNPARTHGEMGPMFWLPRSVAMPRESAFQFRSS